MVEKLLVRKRLLQGEDTRLAALRATLPDVLCPNHSVGSMLFRCEREVLALAQASGPPVEWILPTGKIIGVKNGCVA